MKSYITAGFRGVVSPGAVGGRWCTNCRNGTHNTAFCWGKSVFCYQFGHKASQCRNHPDSKELPGVGGVVKTAGTDVGLKEEDSPRQLDADRTR